MTFVPVPYVKARRAQSPDDHETWETDRPAPTLNAFDNATESRATVLAFHMTQDPISGDVSPSLGTTTAMTPSAVRRLTPVECERLMGWPDDHTRWRADGTEQADSHRYRQCGNGVASPVAEWVAKQIGALS
jgi:DNA (cytosine-5)-methyltransferase 1